MFFLQAMQATWHPECFTCEMCHKELADLGFIKNQAGGSSLALTTCGKCCLAATKTSTMCFCPQHACAMCSGSKHTL